MGKHLFIAEKPSVAQEFAKALKVSGGRRDGYLESEAYVVTWCVGHLVTMSYPEAYDPALKRWSLASLPFLPETFRYEIIPAVEKQFRIVSGLLARDDVERIYVCTDSGREGEYIYRLVEMMSPPKVRTKDRRRVWIDSFTEEEIARGIREARPLSDYDALSDSAYLRAKEDYLMGINFSRLLTLKYGDSIASYLNEKYTVISVGRVMTCVLGMVVRREREIRAFVKQPFYRVVGDFGGLPAEWRAVEGSRYFASPKLWKENGFRQREDAEELIRFLKTAEPFTGKVLSVSRKKEKKNPPLLYNLAELQNDCSRMFKISPDQTLQIAQELYEKKLTTYPRTDARVLSSAVAKMNASHTPRSLLSAVDSIIATAREDMFAVTGRTENPRVERNRFMESISLLLRTPCSSSIYVTAEIARSVASSIASRAFALPRKAQIITSLSNIMRTSA